MVLRPLSLSASMTRWKPSVSSCCASAAFAAGFSFTAASAMGILPEPFSKSIQIVRVFFNVLGEAERMIANEILGTLGVARFKGLDDIHMVADRSLDAVLLADGLAPDHAHVREQVLGERKQHAIAAQADDGLVKFDVGLGVFVEMRPQLAVLEGREPRAQRGDLLIGGGPR